MLFGVWFNGVGMLAEGWVAIGPGAAGLPEGRPRLPLVTYLGGGLNHGHTDKPPLRFGCSQAEMLARMWTASFPGMYEARVLPAILRAPA
jgi:hypothetical protein